ncbi:hypothetical protein ARZXY2_1677 [Arthrobacter sp. ZXY-2]|nr:hypothetical protein ARZXY2_1677 [Arthrobacter sp. ZXY-2]
MQLHQPFLGKPLGESGQGGGTCHGGRVSSKKADRGKPAPLQLRCIQRLLGRSPDGHA